MRAFLSSYSETLRQVILRGGWLARWQVEVDIPVHLVAGDADPAFDVSFLEALVAPLPSVRLSVWPGDHDLPLNDPGSSVEHIRRSMAAAPVVSSPG